MHIKFQAIQTANNCSMTIDPTKICIPPLPTLPSLNATVPEDVDLQKVASLWLKAFAEAIESYALEHLKCLFVEDSWRDMLALTWDFRTFRGLSTIITFLRGRVGITRPRAFNLRPESVSLERSGEDLAWIRPVFDFETEIGIVFGLLRLVPTSMENGKDTVPIPTWRTRKFSQRRRGPCVIRNLITVTGKMNGSVRGSLKASTLPS